MGQMPPVIYSGITKIPGAILLPALTEFCGVMVYTVLWPVSPCVFHGLQWIAFLFHCGFVPGQRLSRTLPYRISPMLSTSLSHTPCSRQYAASSSQSWHFCLFSTEALMRVFFRMYSFICFKVFL